MSTNTEQQYNVHQLAEEIRKLLPAARGSLALVHKPCRRKNCKACISGEKHPAYIFGFKRGGKQYCRHVPPELAPTLKAAIANGRRIEELLTDMGEALILEHRRKRDAKVGT